VLGHAHSTLPRPVTRLHRVNKFTTVLPRCHWVLARNLHPSPPTSVSIEVDVGCEERSTAVLAVLVSKCARLYTNHLVCVRARACVCVCVCMQESTCQQMRSTHASAPTNYNKRRLIRHTSPTIPQRVLLNVAESDSACGNDVGQPVDLYSPSVKG
jgi:hypothetical protein